MHDGITFFRIKFTLCFFSLNFNRFNLSFLSIEGLAESHAHLQCIYSRQLNIRASMFRSVYSVNSRDND